MLQLPNNVVKDVGDLNSLISILDVGNDHNIILDDY